MAKLNLVDYGLSMKTTIYTYDFTNVGDCFRFYCWLFFYSDREFYKGK